MSTATDADRQEATTDLVTAEMVAYVTEVLRSAPPFTDELRERITGLLRTSAGNPR